MIIYSSHQHRSKSYSVSALMLWFCWFSFSL